MRILVVEDHDPSRKLFEAILSGLGHEVDLASGGRDGWDRYRTGRHPVILSDWTMPDMDGLELCRRVRAEASASCTYVMLVTARVGEESYQAARDAGVDDIITKPFHGSYLESRIRIAEQRVGRLDGDRDRASTPGKPLA
jgi:DNA-binding response OmpR family regulator